MTRFMEGGVKKNSEWRRGWLAPCAFALIALAGSMVEAQNAPGKVLLQGTVTDSAGNVLSDSQLVVHWDPSGSKSGLATNVGIPEDRFLKSDTHGAFYAEIPPGFYDVLVTAPGFSPDCRKIRLQPAQNTTFNSKLHADPLVTKELGNHTP
jgi:Carboxypeptidase regulatory-like domain